MHLKWELDNTKDYWGWCHTAASSLVGTTGNQWMFQVLGSIPWQTYFQRVLSAASTGQARLISYLSGLGCFAMAIPSVLIGAVAASTGKMNLSFVCLWVIDVFLAKVIKTGSKEVVIETSNYPAPWPSTPRWMGNRNVEPSEVQCTIT